MFLTLSHLTGFEKISGAAGKRGFQVAPGA
jgi:hypothetical protein